MHPIKVVNTPLFPLAELKTAIADGRLDDTFKVLNSVGGAAAQRKRVLGLVDTFAATYGEDRLVGLFTVAGRSELSGNHTDHNNGCVIAASINLDILAIASPRADHTVRLWSEGFGEDIVDLDAYTTPDESKFGKAEALIAGVADGFTRNGYKVGGFDACTTSSVLKGSGLSSSAAFEDMVGTILSHLYNEAGVDEVTIAKIAQYAENVFFGKPCGLMDQVACAVGGIVAIDFADPKNPIIEPLPLDLTAVGYHLCIVNTGGNHADLTEDYAAIPREMKEVAAFFGKSTLREVSEPEIIAAIPALRESLSDRAVLRALHYTGENRRVAAQKAALAVAIQATDPITRETAMEEYFVNVVASGKSSFCYLQNMYSPRNVSEQGLSIALCLCGRLLGPRTAAAYRVHGGGFAGTVQAYVPTGVVGRFITAMDAAFGKGATVDLCVRPIGAARIF